MHVYAARGGSYDYAMQTGRGRRGEADCIYIIRLMARTACWLQEGHTLHLLLRASACTHGPILLNASSCAVTQEW